MNGDNFNAKVKKLHTNHTCRSNCASLVKSMLTSPFSCDILL